MVLGEHFGQVHGPDPILFRHISKILVITNVHYVLDLTDANQALDWSAEHI